MAAPRSQADLRAVFCEALDRKDPHELAEYLDQACQGSPEIRARVEELLRADDKASGFLQEPCPSAAATIDKPLTERPGALIGPYKLIEQIGEGGFGMVFMAEQRHPVRRRVAVKILKPGMDSREVIARFEAERQALALMDHPNIARILEAGETVSGRPYFVMDLVRGLPITEFCDRNQLTPKKRLELFVSVCQAVQHAHQKGIIHRDLKPSNVLVTLHDETPVVRIIDFGIAKALGPQLTEKTLVTGFAQIVGTPLYMSPEQAQLSGLDIDTRCDIYSLGVLLYELLTGTTPFEKERLHQAGYDEMRRILCEEEPPKPSTRLSTLGQAATTVSEQRRTDPRRLSQLFQGELDWIVMKALEKDRNRRYETASAFAADVERHLNDEPVAARPPSFPYKLRKFGRRNQRLLLTGALLAAVLLVAVAVVATTLGRVAQDRASREIVVANQVAKDLEEADRYLQRENGDNAFTIWHHTLRVLERARGRLEGTGLIVLKAQVEERCEAAAGVVRAGEPSFDSRRPHNLAAFRAALEIFPNSAWLYYNLGYGLEVNNELAQSEAAYRTAIELGFLGGYKDLAGVLYLQGKLAQAEEACRKRLALNPNVAQAYNILAQIFRAEQKLQEADVAWAKAVELNSSYAYTNLGWLLMGQGKFAEALAAFNARSSTATWAAYFIDLDAKWTKIRSGEAEPANAEERVALADLSQRHFRQLYASAARLYSEAFAAQPRLVGPLRAEIRYTAARAAARGGCGQGKDAANLQADDYLRLRQQALAWLRYDLSAWRAESGKSSARKRGALWQMRKWQQDPALAGVRSADALSKLSDGERQEWQTFWKDVEELAILAAHSQ